MNKLNDDRDRAEWLQCLQAAAVLEGRIPSQEGLVTGQDVELACTTTDWLFEEFRRRCA
jgi:hypothetical protein